MTNNIDADTQTISLFVVTFCARRCHLPWQNVVFEADFRTELFVLSLDFPESFQQKRGGNGHLAVNFESSVAEVANI